MSRRSSGGGSRSSRPSISRGSPRTFSPGGGRHSPGSSGHHVHHRSSSPFVIRPVIYPSYGPRFYPVDGYYGGGYYPVGGGGAAFVIILVIVIVMIVIALAAAARSRQQDPLP